MYIRPPHTTGSKCQVELMGPFKNDGSSQIRGFKENSAPATFHGKTKKEKKKGNKRHVSKKTLKHETLGSKSMALLDANH